MLRADTTRFVEDSFIMTDEAQNAALFTTGNGYIGVRGSFEEYGSLRIQGAYIRGIMDEVVEVFEPFAENEYMKKYYIDEEKLRGFESQESVMNNVDFLLLRVAINGETFYTWEGKILSWERYLDMTDASLTRKVRWENEKGDITDFEFKRFSSFDNDHIYCIRVKITPVNYSGKVAVMSGIDTRVKTNGQRISKVIDDKVWDNKCYARVLMGKKFGYETGVTTVTNLYGEDCEWTAKKENELLFSACGFDAKMGKEYIIEKAIYIASSREADVKEPVLLEERFDRYFEQHLAEYKKHYDVVNMEIDGDVEADSGIRFANYHSLISASRNDSVHSVGAKGLTGEMYKNFVWWDCEVYQMPVFIHTCPEAAKMAIMYRYKLLEKAKQNAKDAGLSGAKYPFNCSVTGEERVPAYVRHPFMQVHINADIAWGIINYVTVTGDKELLKDYGISIMCELCEYWKSRVTWKNGRYEILQVTGTDEHHPYVDNDAYTNYLVKFILEKTTEYAKELGLPNDYSDIAENLYLPMEKCGMIPQFDNYFSLSRTLEEAGGNILSNFQMKTSGLYHKSQVIKQPDVMLIFSYLNISPEGADYGANWDYYEHMCESSSSLSYAPHSICAADNGRMLSAYNYLLETAYIDIKDLHHCAWQGVHAGCNAGAWYAVFRGIAGIVCRDGYIEINPHAIYWWNNLSFNFIYHGSKINIQMTPESYQITPDADVKIVFRGKEIDLAAGVAHTEKI